MKSGSAAKYPTMSLNEIKELAVSEIAAKNSILWLWATTPLLPEAFEVMKAWGFAYKTSIFWQKTVKLGLGFWYRGQVELCLLGIRGNVKAFRQQKKNWIASKARKHSQKPEEFWQLIEPVSPSPRIELFAREPRDDWDSWGLELGGDLNQTRGNNEIRVVSHKSLSLPWS